MTDYCPRTDGARSYDAAVAAARADYLANRREGETAAQYDARRRSKENAGSLYVLSLNRAESQL